MEQTCPAQPPQEGFAPELSACDYFREHGEGSKDRGEIFSSRSLSLQTLMQDLNEFFPKTLEDSLVTINPAVLLEG